MTRHPRLSYSVKVYLPGDARDRPSGTLEGWHYLGAVRSWGYRLSDAEGVQLERRSGMDHDTYSRAIRSITDYAGRVGVP